MDKINTHFNGSETASYTVEAVVQSGDRAYFKGIKQEASKLNIRDILIEKHFFIVFEVDEKGQTWLKIQGSLQELSVEDENTPAPAQFANVLIPLQKILYGPPGTGKSTQIKGLVDAYGFEVFRTTFHPDTDYQSFVGGYKPVMVKNIRTDEDEIGYAFVPQIFTKVYTAARLNPERRYLLVVEEINRGNCAQIFGDLFQCLDRNDDGASEYEVDAETDLANHLSAQGLLSKISLPANLYIYATMNTSDQSLFPMDAAFKRRWDWEYVPIDYAKAREYDIEIGDKRYNWGAFIEKVNAQIRDIAQSEDKQMGNFFVKPDQLDETGAKRIISLAAFKSKVMFYLWSEVFKNLYQTSDTIFSYSNEAEAFTEFTFPDLFEAGQDTEILPKFMAKLNVPVL